MLKSSPHSREAVLHSVAHRLRTPRKSPHLTQHSLPSLSNKPERRLIVALKPPGLWNHRQVYFKNTAFAVRSHCLCGQDAAFPCGPQVVSNNVMTENSIGAVQNASGVLVRAGVSDFVIQGNHIGSDASVTQKYGVEVERGLSTR